MIYDFSPAKLWFLLFPLAFRREPQGQGRGKTEINDRRRKMYEKTDLPVDGAFYDLRSDRLRGRRGNRPGHGNVFCPVRGRHRS
jgi:hypothetical protein